MVSTPSAVAIQNLGYAGDLAAADTGMGAASAPYPQASYYAGKVGSMSMAQINKVAQNFESMFLSEMLSPMFDDADEGDAFGSSESSDVYKGMMMDAYGKQIARSGGIGIADYVKKELLKLQESANPVSAGGAAQDQRKPVLRNRYRDSQES